MTKGEEEIEEEKETEETAEAKKGLWDNIRDKKKRMGKDYKPATSHNLYHLFQRPPNYLAPPSFEHH